MRRPRGLTRDIQRCHRVTAALRFLQRLPLGIPELAERQQQAFLGHPRRVVAPLELGALTDRFLELERGLVEIGEQPQGPLTSTPAARRPPGPPAARSPPQGIPR